MIFISEITRLDNATRSNSTQLKLDFNKLFHHHTSYNFVGYFVIFIGVYYCFVVKRNYFRSFSIEKKIYINNNSGTLFSCFFD